MDNKCYRFPIQLGLLALLICVGVNSFGMEDQEEKEIFNLSISGQTTYEMHEPVYLIATLENTSEDPVSVMSQSGSLTGYVLDFEIQGPKGSVSYTAGPERMRIESVSIMTLNSGEKIIGEFNISKYSDMRRPGDYKISAVYYHMLGEDGFQEFRSAPIGFTFHPPKSETQKRLIAECLNYDGKPISNSIYDSDNLYYFKTMGFEEKYLHAVKNFKEETLTKYLAFYLARYYYKSKRYNEAISLLKQVVSEKPFALSDDALLLIGKCYKEVGQEDQASKALSSILKNYPVGNCAKEARLILND